jgi:hypothetical protein
MRTFVTHRDSNAGVLDGRTEYNREIRQIVPVEGHSNFFDLVCKVGKGRMGAGWWVMVVLGGAANV